ncbi:MAG: gluconate 2-dehydrogenase subunit 3 family protein [Halioglobus sp.]
MTEDESATTSSRRQFLRNSGLVLSFTFGAKTLLLTPSEARAKNLPLKILAPAEAATLSAVAEGLVPGARTAGVVHYIDHQLAASQEDSLLMLQYLGVPHAGFSGFYQAALAGAAVAAKTRFNAEWVDLNDTQIKEMIDLFNGPDPEGWTGPPSGFFSFVLRADACDVVYGTESGFDSLDIPYMAHIQPATEW